MSNICKIVVTHKGKQEFAVVDEADYEYLSAHKWYRISRYAYTRIDGKVVLMHRLLVTGTKELEIDHINGNGLDNRRCNLRAITHQQNMWNRRLNQNNKTGFRGVYFDKARQLWHATLRTSGKTLNLGRYNTPEEAAEAYNHGALAKFGSFAQLNKV